MIFILVYHPSSDDHITSAWARLVAESCKRGFELNSKHYQNRDPLKVKSLNLTENTVPKDALYCEINSLG